MKLLLTAFDPFGGEKINPALEAVKQMLLKKNILMLFYVLDKQVEDLT